MFDLLDELATLLSDALDSPWLWLIVFVVAGLDALLPFMPSETTVLTVAVLLGPELAGLALLTAVAATGALAGDLLGHAVGRAAGPRTLRRMQRSEKGRRRYEWAQEKVYLHAGVLIVAGRYLPGGRVASALATGSLRFPLARFAMLDAIGVTRWAGYVVAVGCLGAAQFAGEPAKGLLLAFAIGLLMVGCVEVGRRLGRVSWASSVRAGISVDGLQGGGGVDSRAIGDDDNAADRRAGPAQPESRFMKYGLPSCRGLFDLRAGGRDAQ